MLEVTPGVPVHYVIGLPDEAGLLGQLPGLNVDQARAGGEVGVLVGHDDFAPGAAAGVVEVGEHLQPVDLGNDDEAVIKINQVWLVAVNDLEDLIAPNLAKAGGRRRDGVSEVKCARIAGRVGLRDWGTGSVLLRPVEIAELRLVNIGFEYRAGVPAP